MRQKKTMEIYFVAIVKIKHTQESKYKSKQHPIHTHYFVSFFYSFTMNQNLNRNEKQRLWTVSFVSSRYEARFSDLEHRYHNRYSKIHDFLIENPDVSVGGHRTFPLKGKEYRGCWEYKGDVGRETLRIFYLLIPENHRVLIYYIGPKPNVIPFPPKLQTSTDTGYSSGKKGRTR